MKRTRTILQGVLSMTLMGVLFSPVFARAQNQDPNQYPDQGQGQYPDQGQGQDQNQADPPGRAARLTYEQGAVSLQAAGADQWSDAGRNYPLTSGDRIYVDNGGRAEIQAGQTAVRLSGGTDLTITNLNDQFTQLGLAQGTVRLRTYAFDQNASVELDTPNGAITVVQPGDIRVDSDQGGTVIVVNTGAVQVSGPSLSQEIAAGQSVRLTGSDPVQITNVGMPGYDDFDRFSIDRDKRIQNSQSARYVSRDVVGYDDLDQYGSWDNTPEAGPVWYPQNVAADWEPYRDGHWAYVQPWGWTWVDNSQWGFAPFHYGRWSHYNNRWGWVPGPIAVVPVYSPALVVFIGGIGIGIGGGGYGNGYGPGFGGNAAWFPLGVGEPFVPWYHTSPRYVQRINVTNVNITNIHNTTIVNNYNNFITNTKNVTNVNNINTKNINYVHRAAVTAVPAAAFAAGKPVAQNSVRVTPAQLQKATIVRQGPVAVKPVQAALIRPVTHAAPAVPAARPVVLTRKGPAVALPNARPMAPTPARLGEARPGTPAAAAAAKTAPAARPAAPAVAQPNRPGQPAPQIRPVPPQTNQPNRPVQPARPATPAPGNNNAPRPLITRNPAPVTPNPNVNRVPPPNNQVRPAPAPQVQQRPAPVQPRPAPTPQVQRPAPVQQRPAPTPQVERPAPVQQRPAPTPQVERPAPVQQRPAPTPQVKRPAPVQQRPAPTPQVERPAPVQQRPAPTPQVQRPVQQRPAPTPQVERPVQQRPAPTPQVERPAPAPRPAPQARPEPPPQEQKPPPPQAYSRPAPQPQYRPAPQQRSAPVQAQQRPQPQPRPAPATRPAQAQQKPDPRHEATKPTGR